MKVDDIHSLDYHKADMCFSCIKQVEINGENYCVQNALRCGEITHQLYGSLLNQGCSHWFPKQEYITVKKETGQITLEGLE